LTPERARELLATARVATLATLDREGRPKLVPICFALAGASVWSVVDAKPKRTTELARVKNVLHDGRAAVLAHHYTEDWGELWWVRVEGPARVVESGPDYDQAVALLTQKYEQYRAAPPAGAAVVIEIAQLTGWAAHDTP
jgi:PPOX class probable F420-dependent enzyme